MAICIRRMRTLVLVAALMVPLLGAAGQSASAGQLAGFSYTGPIHGFTIQWQAPWFALETVEEAELGTEGVMLDDGLSTVMLTGSLSLFGDVQETVDAFEQHMISGDPAFTNAQAISDDRCMEDGVERPTASTCFSSTKFCRTGRSGRWR